MAGPDPRRSSRARTHQPQSRPSSTTSSVSGRIERAPKPFFKTGSPQKSTSTASLASEPPDDAAVTDDTPPPPTRSRRATHTNVIKDDDQDLSSVVVSEIEMLNDGDDIQEDDEAVRCICGYDDYPGPPAPEDLKQAAKDGYDVESIFPTVVTDDLAGFFVQCDVCKVWQHGACVGLINDSTLPEEYYCEECRKDLHRIFPGTNGPRCSIYLALNRRRSRTGSFTKDRERTPQLRDSSKDSKDDSKEAGRDVSKEPKSSRPSAISQAGKRRSTMNSRDAAYDEEQLRIAIEASKEGGSDPADGTLRRPKRSRSDDSEEKADSTKRQRTSSRSVSPPAEKSIAADDSDDAMATRNGSSKKVSRSAAAARTQQQRERAEKEEKERQRAEAANKRNGRAERRRVDDSDPSDEVPLAARAAVTSRTTAAPAAPIVTATAAATSGDANTTPTNAPSLSATPTSSTAPRSAPPRPSQPSPETPPPTSAPAMALSKSKGGRPTHKKKGRNQYTKERDARDEQSSATRSRSRDVPESGPGKSGSGSGSGNQQNSKSGSRSKGGANSRISLTEMRRRVSAMSDFIGKTQIDIASGEYLASAAATPEGGAAQGARGGGDAATNVSSAATTPSSATAPQQAASEGAVASSNSTGAPEKDFKQLPLLEMMDTLTRDIIHWQSQYGG